MIPVFALDPAIRKIVYTTNAIESLNRLVGKAVHRTPFLSASLRKAIKTRGPFPTEEAAIRLIYLAIRSFEKGGRNVRDWFAARDQLAIMFEDRFAA